MKNKFKLISSLILILGLFLTLPLLFSNAGATEPGKLTLTIEARDGTHETKVFDFHVNDTLFDLLNKDSSIVCANASYQPDLECKHKFRLNPFDAEDYDYFVLGVTIDDLSIMTDMQTTYLKFMVKNSGDSEFTYSIKGIRNIELSNGMHILIKEEGVSNG